MREEHLLKLPSRAALAVASLVVVVATGFGLSGLAVAAGPATSPAKASISVSAELPLAGRFTPDLKRRSTVALHKFAASTLGRLLLDEQEYAVDTVTDIADLVVAVAALDILRSRKDAPAETQRLAAQAASVLHRLGWVYHHDPDLRRRIGRYVSGAKDTAARETATQLRKSLDRFEKIGLKWFPAAYKALGATGAKDASLLNLHGLWLKQSGKLRAAGEVFERAFSMEPRSSFALNAYEVAVAQQRKDVGKLRTALSKRLPAIGGALVRIAAEFEDRQKTRAFEAAPAKQTPAALLVQAERYSRQGARHKGDALVKEALGEVSKASPADVRAAALYWMQSRRDAKALALLAQRPDLVDPKAPDKDRTDAGRAWRSLHLALAVRTRLDALGGGKFDAGPAVSRAWESMGSGLASMRATKGTQALHADVLEAFIAIRESTVARARADDDALAPAQARVAKGRRILRTEHKTSTLGALARTGAALAADGPAAATKILRGAIGDVPRAQRPLLTLLLAEQEVGLGLRGGDAKLVRQGLKRLAGLSGAALTDPIAAARRDYLAAIGTWLQAAGAGTLTAKMTRSTTKTLQHVLRRFDPETPIGARYAGAAAWSLGTVALSAGDKTLAHRAFQRARRFVERPLHPFAGAVAALAKFDDAYGAGVLLDEALATRTGAPLGFSLRKWRALVAQKRGDVAGATRHLKKMLALAKSARAPKVVTKATGSPLLIGDLAMSVGVKSLAEPGAVMVEITGVVFALPDFDHDLSQIRSLIRQLPKSPSPSRKP